MTNSEKYRPKLTKKQARRTWRRESGGERRERKNPKLVMIQQVEFFGIVMMISAGILFFLWLTTSKGKILFEESFSLQQFQDSSSLTTKVFELDKKMSVCQISLEADISTNYGVNTAADFAVELYDEEEDEMVNAFEGEFWYEWGYDDGERWQESSNKISQILKVANTQKYRAEISAENINVTFSLMSSKINFRVRKGSALKARYFGWSALILGILAIIILAVTAEQKKKL